MRRVEAQIVQGKVHEWKWAENGDAPTRPESIQVELESLFECRVPLQLLGAPMGSTLRVRFSLWRDRLPLDALPQEGAVELRLVPEDELGTLAYAKP